MVDSPGWLALLQLAGVGVVIAEVFLPSGGLLSLLAVGLFGYSIYGVYTGVSVAAGVAVALADLVIIPILVIVGLKLVSKSPATLSHELSRTEGVVAQDVSETDYVGKTGTTLSDLRPAGTAAIGGRRVDVVSQGDYIRRGTEIVVEEVSGNRVVVRGK